MDILKTEQLTKQYGKQTVVHPLTLTLAEKKCIALIGPNGAGKTTTLRMITGLITPTSGSIQFMSYRGDYRKLIGYLPQHPMFYEWMTGEEYLIYSARLSSLLKQTAIKQAHYLLEKLGLFEARKKRISTYSGGMKQRLGIAQAMIHQPKILVLDEPVSALDPAGRREILTLIEELKEEMTILFSTHILADADEVCDEIIVLDRGEIIEVGSIEAIRNKYKTETIELTFLDSTIPYEIGLANLEHVDNVQMIRGVYHLNVTNIKKASHEILSLTTAKNWQLASFHLNQASLEDIFMKAVQA